MNRTKVDLHCMVPATIKKKTSAIFKKLGMNQSLAINIFLNQVVEHNGLPFKLAIPNKETIKAMEETKRGRGKLAVYSSSKELFNSLNED